MKRNFFLNSLLIFTFILLSKGELMGENFTIKSTGFTNGGKMPEKNSCDGPSPELVISEFPKNTKEWILIIEDPDAKNGEGRRKTFIHLIAQFGIDVKKIPEGEIKKLAENIIANDTNSLDYFGPCPPKNGKDHSYYFTAIGLNKHLDIDKHTKDYFRNTWIKESRFYKERVDDITGIAQLMGKYGRK